VQWRVPLFEPDLGQPEVDALTRVIRSKWLTMGELTAQFEQRFAASVGCEHALAVNSGTAALHLALAAADIAQGDDVVCPALTFVATANAIRYTGARPVFADVASLDEWNVSRATLEAVTTPATKAVIVMHYGGHPCDMASIRVWAQERRMLVIEDAAHAPGARAGGRAMGNWGDFGCFSFFSNKNLTTGEGGMVTTQRGEVMGRLRRLRSHGMTTVTLDRHRGHAYSYDVSELGYNYRMSELNAALGLVQLEALGPRNRQRRELVGRYRSNLENVTGLSVPFRRARGEAAHHLMPVLLPPGCDRPRVMERLKETGIQTSIHYRPVDTFTAYQDAALGPCAHLPLTHEIGARQLTLPLYPSMPAKAVDYVCDHLAQALQDA
jgi:dTDP-4-amino-4,6-dideoxygalactose transaminase